MSDERARFEVLLEEIRSQFGVLADGHVSLKQAIDGNHTDLSSKLDTLAHELDEFKVTTSSRLGRIEHHVGLNGVATPAEKTLAQRPKRKK